MFKRDGKYQLLSRSSRYRVSKVIKLKSSTIKMEIENDTGSHLVFLLECNRWKWYTTKHRVDDKLNKMLHKQYRRWLKKSGGI